MEEPLASINPVTAGRSQVCLHSEGPATVVFVTHHIDEAVFLADRVPVQVLLDHWPAT